MQLTQSDLLSLLKQPKAIATETLTDLEELALRYPYFQAVHTLIAKVKHDRQVPDAEAALHRAAIYAPDRRHLRKIILEEVHHSPTELADQAAPSTEEDSEPVDALVVSPKVLEPVVTDENEPEATVSTVESSETTVVTEEDEGEPVAAEVQESVSSTEPAATDEVDERETVYDALEKNLKNLQAARSAQRTEDQKPVTPRSAQQEQQELMDKFVSHENDTLPTPTDHATTTADLAEKSTQAPEELVTENLAEIFIKQGKVDKGLALYEKLSLKFPEKKAYFADKIEQLKK